MGPQADRVHLVALCDGQVPELGVLARAQVCAVRRRIVDQEVEHTLLIVDATKYGFCVRIHAVVGTRRDAMSTGSRYLLSGLCDRTGALALPVAQWAGNDVDPPSRPPQPNCPTAADSP